MALILPVRRTTMQTMLGILLVIVATALGAQIEPLAATPFADAVPGTLQTLAVLAGGALLGPGRGALAMLGYLALGLVGVPVFHDWKALPPADFVNYFSAGYLIGFIPAAAFAGWAAQRWRSLLGLLLVMLLGHLIVLGIGAPVLAAWTSIEFALERGLINLLPGMGIKSALGALLVYFWRVRRSTSTSSS